MDEMLITSIFTRGIVSKLIRRVLKKKTGYDVDIHLNEFRANSKDGKTYIHLDIDANLEKDELVKILKSVGLM